MVIVLVLYSNVTCNISNTVSDTITEDLGIHVINRDGTTIDFIADHD